MLRYQGIFKRCFIGISIVAAVFLIAACQNTNGTIEKQSVSSVTVSGASAGDSLQVGNTVTLNAVVAGDNLDADSKGVNWTVTGGVAIVPAGNSVTVSGISPGSATVTATSAEDSSVAQTISLTVEAKPVAPVATTGGLDISVSPASAKVVVKNKADDSVVSDATGGSLLTDLDEGTYSIASSAEGYDSSTLDVNVLAGQTKSLSIGLSKTVVVTPATPTTPAAPVTPTARVVAVTSAPSSVTLDKGETVTVVATVFGEGSYSDSVRFSSADTTVATVDATTGIVTAVSSGVAVIKAISIGTPNIFGTTTVTVNAETTPTVPTQTGGNPPQPVLSVNTFDPYVLGKTYANVEIAETDSELKSVKVYAQPVTDCASATFVPSEATLIWDRVFVGNSNALSTQGLTYFGDWDTSALNGTTPKHLNGDYLVIAESTSYSDKTAYDKQCVEVRNTDTIDIQISGNSAKDASNATWYGNGDITVTATPILYTNSTSKVVDCSSTVAFNQETPSFVKQADGSFVNRFLKANNLFENRSTMNCNYVVGSGNSKSKSFNLDNIVVAPRANSIVYKVDRNADGAYQNVASDDWYKGTAVFTFDASGLDAGVGASPSTSVINALTDKSPDRIALLKANVKTGADLLQSTQDRYVYLDTTILRDRLGNSNNTSGVTYRSPEFAVDFTVPAIGNILTPALDTNGLQTISLGGFEHDNASDALYAQVTTAPISYTTVLASSPREIAPVAYSWSVFKDGIDCGVLATINGSILDLANSNNFTNRQCKVNSASTGVLRESYDIQVFVKAVDAAGNESSIASSTYKYDVSKPKRSVVPTPIQGQTNTIVINAVDNLGVARMQLIATPPVGTTAGKIVAGDFSYSGTNTSESATFSYTPLTGYTYDVIAFDSIGNDSIGAGDLSPTAVNIVQVDLDPNDVIQGQPSQVRVLLDTNAGVNKIDILEYINGVSTVIGQATRVGTSRLYTFDLDTSVLPVSDTSKPETLRSYNALVTFGGTTTDIFPTPRVLIIRPMP